MERRIIAEKPIQASERDTVESVTDAIRLWYHGIVASPLIKEEIALRIASRAAIAGFEIPQLRILVDAKYSSLYGGIEGAQTEIRDILTRMLARKQIAE